MGLEVEITLVTYWRAAEDIAAFAGENVFKARLYPGDEIYEIVPDHEVRHYEVLSQEIPKA